MKIRIILTWVVFTLFGLTPLAWADVLTMPQAPSQPAAASPAPAPATAGTIRQTTSETVPGRGMTMKQVQAKFGPPLKKLPAVGKPPITRWVYGNYTVYFEYNIALDSVIHHP